MSNDKILVMGPSWVGDMVLAQGLFKQLKHIRPDCTIDVAAPAWTLPLLARMPEVNQAIALPFQHKQLAFWQRIKIGRSLRSAGYTQAIILTNSFKSAILPFAAGIKRRTSFLGEMRYGLVNDIRPLDKKVLPRTIDRFVALGLDPAQSLPEIIPEPALMANYQNGEVTLGKLGIESPKGKVLGLCPGAEYGEAKRWPVEHYAQVANDALTKGWQVWLFGSEKDMPVTSQINKLTQNQCIDFGGRTKLGEAIDLMAKCNAVVSNDSGLMHVAAALGKPLAAIYGSSDPHHTPPMSSVAEVLYQGLACSPCFQRECPLKAPSEHLACLQKIPPATVIKRLKI